MSVPEAKTIKTMKEIFADSEEFALRVSESRKKAGLPEFDSLEIQKKYKDIPISPEIDERVEKRIAAYNARRGIQS